MPLLESHVPGCPVRWSGYVLFQVTGISLSKASVIAHVIAKPRVWQHSGLRGFTDWLNDVTRKFLSISLLFLLSPSSYDWLPLVVTRYLPTISPPTYFLRTLTQPSPGAHAYPWTNQSVWAGVGSSLGKAPFPQEAGARVGGWLLNKN